MCIRGNNTVYRFKPIEWQSIRGKWGMARVGNVDVGSYTKVRAWWRVNLNLSGFDTRAIKCWTESEARAAIEQAYENFKNLFAVKVNQE